LKELEQIYLEKLEIMSNEQSLMEEIDEIE